MSYHEEIISTALLGTQKKVLQTEFLPQAIADMLQQIPFEDEEAKFFQAVGLWQQYQKAGTLEVLIDLPEMPAPQAETQEYIDTNYQKALDILLNSEKHYDFFWDLFVEKTLAAQKIITPNFLVDFLEYMSGKATYKAQIAHLIGNRGKWLCNFNANWENYEAIAQKPTDIWNPKKVEKKDLAQLRKENPQAAREYILQHWEEFDTTRRANFVDIFQENLSQEDEEALLWIWQWVLAKKIEDNQYLNQLKNKAVTNLLLIPNSALSQEIWEIFKTYLVLEKGKIQLKLPKKPDSFFNQEQMWKRLGLLEQSYNTTWYNDIEGWAYELLRHTNPVYLEKHFQLDKTDILQQFNKNETLVRSVKKQTLALYTRALADAAWHFKSAEWAEAWINCFKNLYSLEEIGVSHLSYLLSWDVVENLYENHISLETMQAREWLHELFNHPNEKQWSEKFSVFFLQKVLLNATLNYINPMEMQKAFLFLHPKAFEQIAKEYPDEKASNWQQHTYTKTYKDLSQFKELSDLLR